MTDFKRFVMLEDDTYGEDATLIDRDTNKIFYDNFSDMVDVMNEINLIALHRSELYIAADMLINDLADCYLTCEDVVDRLNELNDENQELKKRMINIIRESIKNERTDMGRNALKQLADNLGVDYD